MRRGESRPSPDAAPISDSLRRRRKAGRRFHRGPWRTGGRAISSAPRPYGQAHELWTWKRADGNFETVGDLDLPCLDVLRRRDGWLVAWRSGRAFGNASGTHGYRRRRLVPRASRLADSTPLSAALAHQRRWDSPSPTIASSMSLPTARQMSPIASASDSRPTAESGERHIVPVRSKARVIPRTKGFRRGLDCAGLK